MATDPLAAELARIAARHGLTGTWQKPDEAPSPPASSPSPRSPCPSSDRPHWREQQRTAAREALLAAAGLPQRHRDRTATDWPGKAWERVGEAILAGGTVALVGKRGTGKTQMAAELVKSATRGLGKSAWYTRADDLFDAMRAEFDGKGRGKIMQRAARVGLLVIDELQVRFDSAFEDRELTRLIDKRYGSMLPSVLIANLTPEAFWESVGPSIGDRMREGGTVIVCDWGSFRSKQ